MHSGPLQGEECGVLIWDEPPPSSGIRPCTAPLARAYQPREPASCVALSPPPLGTPEVKSGGPPADGAMGLCAVGYTTGRVQIICVGGLRLLKERRVHVAAICCIEFGPAPPGEFVTLLTAAIDGEIRLSTATPPNQLLVPIATLRPPNGGTPPARDQTDGRAVPTAVP